MKLVERMKVRIAEIESEYGEDADEWMEDDTLILLREAAHQLEVTGLDCGCSMCRAEATPDTASEPPYDTESSDTRL